MSRGVVVSVSGSVLFAALFYLGTLLLPLSGFEILGWRILFMTVILSLHMLAQHELPLISDVLAKVRARPWYLLAMPLCAALVGYQFWLFAWGPLTGRAMEVSLGYFLFPLVMVICGRVFYKERLSRLQKIAVIFAALGVGNQLWQVGAFSWVSLTICTLYPLYFMLRRRLALDTLGGFWWDLCLLCPPALWFIATGATSMSTLLGDARLMLLLALYGGIGGVAMTCFILASKLLSMSLFGLLSYVEPVLLATVAFLLGTSIRAEEWGTYIGIWLAVILLILDGARNVIHAHRVATAEWNGKNGTARP